MNLKHAVLKILVWNMRWMTRYLGFIARPFVKWYADQEVIACALRSEKDDIQIMYSPMPGRFDHSFLKKEKRKWETVNAFPTDNFSGDLVLQVILPDAKKGEVYVVRAQKGNNGRTVYSPKITIKERTHLAPGLIEVNSLPNGRACISWKKGEMFDPMIYFFTLENDRGETLVGIYTRDNTWIYPFIKRASLSIGKTDPTPLQKNKQYTAKLTIVDFDGWVSCIGKKVFTY